MTLSQNVGDCNRGKCHSFDVWGGWGETGRYAPRPAVPSPADFAGVLSPYRRGGGRRLRARWGRDSRLRGNDDFSSRFPAYAGMTWGVGIRGDGAPRAPSAAPCGADWIPAYAGMTVRGGMTMMGAMRCDGGGGAVPAFADGRSPVGSRLRGNDAALGDEGRRGASRPVSWARRFAATSPLMRLLHNSASARNSS